MLLYNIKPFLFCRKNLQPEQEANVHAEDILEMDGDANRIDHSPITVAAEVHHPTIVIAEVHHPSADDDWDSGDDDIALIHFCP